jgi:hypothetical protein
LDIRTTAEAKMRRATFPELQELLNHDHARLLSAIGNISAQLSIPVDGRGLRVLVETEDGLSKGVPSSVNVIIGGEDVEIVLESRDSIQEYVPLND